MKNYKIIDTDAGNIGNFGMCGYKNPKHTGYQRKIEWVKERFGEGMKYKILLDADGNAVGAIEYIPAEYAWRPVDADGYLFIHCLYIMKKPARDKGYGVKLVNACIEDARARGKYGVAVIARKGSWMAGFSLFEKMGFKAYESARPDFKLMALKFDMESCSPRFSGLWVKELKQHEDGLTIFTSDQCPYLVKSVIEIIEVAESELGITPNIIHIENSEQAKKVPCAFGCFCMIYKGKVVAENPISKTRFKNIMKKELA
jgi:ribosomal protein S18 acetylase RimI-like enzyme